MGIMCRHITKCTEYNKKCDKCANNKDNKQNFYYPMKK